MRTLFVGSDHAGFNLKKQLISYLTVHNKSFKVMDCGCYDSDSVDYPLIAEVVSEKVTKESDSFGILICGTGIGMSIAANKIKGIRAATVWNEETAKLSREHNNANILCLGARMLSEDLARQISTVWLNTSFLGGRHLNRVNLITSLEGKP